MDAKSRKRLDIGGQIPGEGPYRQQKFWPVFFDLLCVSCNSKQFSKKKLEKFVQKNCFRKNFPKQFFKSCLELHETQSQHKKIESKFLPLVRTLCGTFRILWTDAKDINLFTFHFFKKILSRGHSRRFSLLICQGYIAIASTTFEKIGNIQRDLPPLHASNTKS